MVWLVGIKLLHLAKAHSMGKVGDGLVTPLTANNSDQGTQVVALGMDVDKTK